MQKSVDCTPPSPTSLTERLGKTCGNDWEWRREVKWKLLSQKNEIQITWNQNC